ncbi:MAG: AFG1 family ATPase [Rickettsiales bacterium]|nr:AFG1 family ATPase [Rickettsiales bacterium]
MPTTLVDTYNHLVDENKVKRDPAQEKVLEKLQKIQHSLADYLPKHEQNLFQKLFGKKDSDPIKGLYIYGGVGRGKSMLMDLYYQNSTVKKKRRVHFHAFMLEVHERMHEFRKTHTDIEDPISYVAKDIADDAWLFCFDEMHVNDIADAMVIGRLFKHLFERGVILITTSNRHPDELYKNGLQREHFVPFIELLKEKVDVVELSSQHDYRLQKIQNIGQTYFYPLDQKAHQLITTLFDDMIHEMEVKKQTLNVQGRELTLKHVAGDILLSSFDELCAQPLGSADYIEIANEFSTVIVQNIPKLRREHRNEAKRFVMLIDELYEHRVKFICSAEVKPQELYTEGREAFEFERTVSRLIEMQSEPYWKTKHRIKNG